LLKEKKNKIIKIPSRRDTRSPWTETLGRKVKGGRQEEEKDMIQKTEIILRGIWKRGQNAHQKGGVLSSTRNPESRQEKKRPKHPQTQQHRKTRSLVKEGGKRPTKKVTSRKKGKKFSKARKDFVATGKEKGGRLRLYMGGI